MSQTTLPNASRNASRNADRFFSFSFRPGGLLKRIFDLLASALGLILLSPIFALLARRIRRDSPGPVFYHGARVGRGGRVFQILKFRTMYERHESYTGPRITAQDDERITPYGKFLRDSKINELPQLWNVLKGEMSLVGPRPEDPEVAAAWPEEARREVLSVRPGITSPASVLYRDEEMRLAGGRVMDTYLGEILPSKLRLDQLYVRHHSFWGDLDIIFWTLLLFVPKIGKYSPPEEFLFLGPLSRLMRRHVSWFLVDTLITFLAMGIAGLFWRLFGPLNVGWGPAILVALGFALLKSVTGAVVGVNRIDWSRAAASDALDLIPGIVVATLVALLANFFWPAGWLGIKETGAKTPWGMKELLPTSLILMAAGLAFMGIIVVRYRGRLITGLATRWLALRGDKSTALERVLIIGGGATGQFAAWMLNNNRAYSGKLHVAGLVDDDLFMQGSRVHGLNVLGRRADIPQLVEQHDIGILVFAIHNISAKERQQLLDICTSTPAQVVLFPDIPAVLNGITHNGAKRDKAGGNGYKAQKEATPETQPGGAADPADYKPLPCELCLTTVSPMKVDGWLAQLEEAAHEGNIDEVMAQINALRGQLRGDVAVQMEANTIANPGHFPGQISEVCANKFAETSQIQTTEVQTTEKDERSNKR